MPTSNLLCWPSILHLAWEAKPHRVLDVGPGHGKAAVLLEEYIGRPPIHRVDAVEMWEPYIKQFDLERKYDQVIVGDVKDMSDSALAEYDLVLMVDVLEHMEKDDACELLARIPGYVIICTPRDFFQNPEHRQIPPEAHRSLWRSTDFGDRVDRDDVVALNQFGAVLVRLKHL